jgi:hypothetical protein
VETLMIVASDGNGYHVIQSLELEPEPRPDVAEPLFGNQTSLGIEFQRKPTAGMAHELLDNLHVSPFAIRSVE